MQLLLGLILSIIQVGWENSRRSERSLIGLSSEIKNLVQSRSSFPLWIGFFHFIGTAFTNASFAILGSTSTLVWKLSEPLSVALLKWSILGKKTSTFSLVGIFHLILGVMIFSRSALSSLAVSPIMVANLAYPARNVASKYYQDRNSENLSGAERFLRIYLSCFPFVMLAFIGKGIGYGIHVKLLHTMLANALLFNMYQFSSLALLDMLDALTHAVGNTLKRVFGVILSTMLNGDTIERPQKGGLGLACLGVLYYFLGEWGSKVPKRAHRFAKGVGCVLSILAMTDLIFQANEPLASKWVLTADRLWREIFNY